MSNTIISPPKRLLAKAYVLELINDESHCWKFSLLDQLFSEYEVGLITSIPLSLCDIDDQLVWFYSKNANFSIRSAYHLHKDCVIDILGPSPMNQKPISCGNNCENLTYKMELGYLYGELVKMFFLLLIISNARKLLQEIYAPFATATQKQLVMSFGIVQLLRMFGPRVVPKSRNWYVTVNSSLISYMC